MPKKPTKLEENESMEAEKGLNFKECNVQDMNSDKSMVGKNSKNSQNSVVNRNQEKCMVVEKGHNLNKDVDVAVGKTPSCWWSLSK